MAGLYISATGILNAQRRLDITANNIANVQTPGYRAARADSVDLAGGGSRVASVTYDDAGGPLLPTGRPLDIASGEGFFRVRQADGSIAYTRDGHFGLDAQGQIVTASGAVLDPPVQVPAGSTNVRVLSDGNIIADVPGEAGSRSIGRIEPQVFSNPDALAPLDGGLYSETAASGTPHPAGAQSFVPGYLTGSNVDVATETVNTLINKHAFLANINALRAQDETLGELINLSE